MGVLTVERTADETEGIRPLDILRDLDGVGELINIAFAEDIAREGSQIQHDLMLLQLTSPLLWFLRRLSGDIRDSFDGFVSVDAGRIVGNVTLTRDNPARRVWTITNVAVRPEFRRRGIARSLMEACIETVAERGGGVITLEVKAANDAAYDLYRKLGFAFVDGTVTMQHSGRISPSLTIAKTVHRVQPKEWQKVYELEKDARSILSQEISPLLPEDFQQSATTRLTHAVRDIWAHEQRFLLAIQDGGRFLAGARLLVRSLRGTTVNLTVHPAGRKMVEDAMVYSILAACKLTGQSITLQVSSAEEDALAALSRAGFTELRNLHRLARKVPSGGILM